MVSWILVPSLVSLRTEFDRLAPGRDKASDGSIGDQSHAASSSDHNPDETGRTPSEDADSINEVHAIDLDSNLRRDGWDMQRAVDIIVARHRNGDDDRLQNVIYNRRIWSRSWGWTPRAYSGASAHTEHAHFSARYTTAQEADTSPWGLATEEGDMLVRKGDTGEEVKFWQHVLNDLGYSVGEVDGDYGAKTEAAVNAYRQARSQGPAAYVSGWCAWSMLRDLAVRHAAGKPGPPGPPGPKGDPGPAGRLTGTLTVTGGQLTVEAGA